MIYGRDGGGSGLGGIVVMVVVVVALYLWHSNGVSMTAVKHWYFKSIKNGFAIAIVACLKNLNVLSLWIDAQKSTHYTLQDTKKNE